MGQSVLPGKLGFGQSEASPPIREPSYVRRISVVPLQEHEQDTYCRKICADGSDVRKRTLHGDGISGTNIEDRNAAIERGAGTVRGRSSETCTDVQSEKSHDDRRKHSCCVRLGHCGGKGGESVCPLAKRELMRRAQSSRIHQFRESDGCRMPSQILPFRHVGASFPNCPWNARRSVKSPTPAHPCVEWELRSNHMNNVVAEVRRKRTDTTRGRTLRIFTIWVASQAL